MISQLPRSSIPDSDSFNFIGRASILLAYWYLLIGSTRRMPLSIYPGNTGHPDETLHTPSSSRAMDRAEVIILIERTMPEDEGTDGEDPVSTTLEFLPRDD